MSCPTYGTRGFGIKIVVCPAYAINNGRAAIDGKSNFLLLTVTSSSVSNSCITSEKPAEDKFNRKRALYLIKENIK